MDFKGEPQGARVSVLPLDRVSTLVGLGSGKAIGKVWFQTRVIEQMSVHGGFSIFYALLLGADLHLLSKLGLI